MKVLTTLTNDAGTFVHEAPAGILYHPAGPMPMDLGQWIRTLAWLRRVASLAPPPARTDLLLGPDPLDRQIELFDQRVGG